MRVSPLNSISGDVGVCVGLVRPSGPAFVGRPSMKAPWYISILFFGCAVGAGRVFGWIFDDTCVVHLPLWAMSKIARQAPCTSSRTHGAEAEDTCWAMARHNGTFEMQYRNLASDATGMQEGLDNSARGRRSSRSACGECHFAGRRADDARHLVGGTGLPTLLKKHALPRADRRRL